MMGSSMAEAHPVGFRWVMKAKERGARIIHVDPRFSRTSALAHQHVAIRAGSDVAFLGGLIHHVLETGAFFEEYVKAYTNAATILREDFQDTEDLAGVFSGYDPETGTYDKTTWAYESGQPAAPAGQREHADPNMESGADDKGLHGPVERDETLQDPRCVFQVLKRHFARYTPEMVERITGVPRDEFLQVAQAIVENSGRERTTAWCYAVGWTHHTSGVQIIRSCAILQLLMGNIGRPGGSIMALRGHATIQGATDIPTLYDQLPGYLPMPRATEEDLTLEKYIATGGARRGWWSNYDKYIVSLLKAWYGDAATPENDYGFGAIPRISGNHSHFPTMLRALDGGLDGLLVMGQNPAVGSQNAGLMRRAMAQLKWLVVRDLSEIETASFWYDSPEVKSGELRTEDIQTEVFLMPAASHVEKAGSFTNTQRLVQWRDKALDPPDEARSELWFMHHLIKRIKAHYAGSTAKRDWGVVNLRWDYTEHADEDGEPDVEDVVKEINGYGVADGKPVSGFTALEADGSTACGAWIYSGIFADGVNQARRRDPGDVEAEGGYVSPEWGWAWPANRRLLYNRASSDPEGRPWSERKKYVWWDEDAGRWTGYDIPDYPVDKAPSYRPADDAVGMDAIRGDQPFIMMEDGVGWLYAPSGIVDGPLPTYYEPVETPVDNLLYPERGANPVAMRWTRAENPLNPMGEFPLVATTFRLTEQHTAGGMSRPLPWLNELQPEMFAEIDPVVAADRGIEDGGWMTIMTARGEIEAKAKVTDRMRPLKVDGRPVHQIGLPWHWGYAGGPDETGDTVNDLTAIFADPNVSIEDTKSWTCDVRAGRRRGQSTERLRDEHERPRTARADRDHPSEHPHHGDAEA